MSLFGELVRTGLDVVRALLPVRKGKKRPVPKPIIPEDLRR